MPRGKALKKIIVEKNQQKNQKNQKNQLKIQEKIKNKKKSRTSFFKCFTPPFVLCLFLGTDIFFNRILGKSIISYNYYELKNLLVFTVLQNLFYVYRTVKVTQKKHFRYFVNEFTTTFDLIKSI